MTDDHAFEVVYFRPFNFRADEPFKGRAVHYISAPGNGWEALRKNFPGKFESAVNPVPDPDDWFHARIEVGDKLVYVFVDHAKTPSLVVNRIAESRQKRPMGLFVDSADGYYKNFKVTHGLQRDGLGWPPGTAPLVAGELLARLQPPRRLAGGGSPRRRRLA